MASQRLTDSLRETLSVFDAGGEPRTTSEVADRLDLGRRSTYDRLDRLVDEGYLRTKKVGASARVWWRVPDPGADGSGEASSPDWPDAAESLVDDVLAHAAVGVFVLDAADEVAWINDAAERYFGLDRESVLGRDKPALVRERIAETVEDSTAFAERVLSTYGDEDAGERRFECHVTAGEGREERWLEHRSKPIESGAYAGGRVELYYDVTDRVRSKRELAAQRDQFERLVDAVEEYAIFRIDEEGYVETWNTGAQRLKGYGAEEIVGQHFSTFYTEADREAGAPEENLAAAAAEGWTEDEGWRVRADGSRFWANVTITAIRDDDGEITGYVKVTRDMTERRAFERELERERDLLDRTFDAIPVGVAVFDGEEIVRMNEQTRLDLGLDESDDGRHEWATAVYDEDGERVPREELPRVRALRTGEPVRDWIGRADLPGLDERWLSITALPLTGDDGAVDRVVVSTEDVTQLKEQARRLERRRADLESELDEVLDRIEDGFFALDGEWRFTYVNERASDLLERPRNELVGASFWDEFAEAVGTEFEEQYRRAHETGESVSFEAYYPPLATWFEVSAHPSESGLSVYFRDVTDRKERERELERYETIVETVDDGIYVVDEDGYFTQVNRTYAEMVGRSRAELIGAHVSTVVEGETLAAAREIEAELAAGERATATLEATLEGPDGGSWIGEATFSLMETEVGHERVAAVRDVTERREREHELEQYEAVAQAASDVIVSIDEASVVRDVNPAVTEVFGHEPEDLVGESLTAIMPDRFADAHLAALDEYVETGERSLDWEYLEMPGVRADGTEVPLAISFSEYEHGGERYFTGILRDISDRKARERELERYEAIVETVDDGVYAVDEEGRFVLVNEAFSRIVGYEREELLELTASDLYDEEYESVVQERAAAVESGERDAATIELELVRKDGTRVPVETRYEPFTYGDTGEVGRCGVVRDVTERIERERELQRRVSQQQVVTELGQRALESGDLDALMAEAAERVATTLDNDYCKVLDLDPEAEELRLRQGVGWREGVVGEATVSAVEADSQAAYTLESADPVVVSDLTTETRFSGPDLLRDHDVKSGISVIIGSADDPWGILGTHDTEVGEFSEQDVNFVRSVATTLATAIDRREYEETLVAQREQLAALNSLNEVVRETTDAVLDQGTREEIERTVCEHLAASDSYEFAWIGEVDTNSKAVVGRAEAGVDGYVDDVSITIDPDDERSEGPTGRAVRTGEVHSLQRIRSNPRYEPWRGAAEEYGFRASASSPIVYEGTTYGVLNVYADRPDAFTGQERTVLGQLGEVVGHAIAATDRKQALLSDEVVELEFEITDLFEALDLSENLAGRFEFDHVIALGDEEFLVYGQATAEAVPTLRRLTDALPHWTDASFADGEGEETRFELRMDEPPVLSTLAALGGSVEHAVVEDGDYRMTLHVSPSADVRQVIDAVTEAYPTATMLRRQQVSNERRSQSTDAVFADLTDRQRTTLEAAYHAGFFEWPRDASGEDVADSLQVSPPTFHQHLRKAEGKVFGALFEARA